MRKLLGSYINGFNSIFVFFAIFFIIFGVILYSVLGKSAGEALTTQTLKREQNITRSGASSIKSFLELAGRSLTLLSRNDDVNSMGSNTKIVLEKFISDWQSTPVVSVFLADKEGNILFTSDRKGFVNNEDVSVTDRDYYLWAKKAAENELFLGRPILLRLEEHRNQYIVPLATPFIKNGEFAGVLVAAILLSDLVEDYLEPLKICENTQVYLLNSEGFLLHTPSQDLVGLNAFDRLRDYPFLGSEVIMNLTKEKLSLKKEGRIDIVYPVFSREVLARMLIAYAPISFGERHWLLAVATPVDDALALIAPVYINQLAVLVVGFLSLIIIAVVIAKTKAYKEGFIDYDRMLQRLRKK